MERSWNASAGILVGVAPCARFEYRAQHGYGANLEMELIIISTSLLLLICNSFFAHQCSTRIERKPTLTVMQNKNTDQCKQYRYQMHLRSNAQTVYCDLSG